MTNKAALIEKFNKLPDAERQSILLKATGEVLAEQEEKRNADKLQQWLNSRIVKAYADRDTYGRWKSLMRDHRMVEADEILDEANQRYRDAIKRHGNPDDQIANFERFGVIMQDKQLEFAAAARLADDDAFANEVGLGGARGPGKSFAVFAQSTLDDCQRFPGLKVLYLRKTGKKASEQAMDLVKAVLPKMKKGRDYEQRERPDFKLTFENGSEIIVGYYKTEADALEYQGLEYDLLIIEELTHLSLEAYKTLRTSVRSSKENYRPRVYVSTNPGSSGHAWVKKRFVDPEKKKLPLAERDNKTKFIFATVHDNHFVNADYVDNLEDLTGAKKEIMLEGNWDVSAGAFFRTWSYDYHVVNSFETIPPDMRVWMAMDYGFGHWNMTYLLGSTGERTYLIHELAHRLMYPKDIAPEIFKMLDRYEITIERLDYILAGADVFRKTGHAERTIQQKYADEGIILFPADNSPGSRSAGAQHIGEMLGDPANKDNPVPSRLLVCRNCEHFIETLPYLEHDPNNLEDVLKVDTNVSTGEGGDDAYDAARYGLFTPMIGSMASGGKAS